MYSPIGIWIVIIALAVITFIGYTTEDDE